MNTIQLENENLHVAISALGAQITSFYDVKRGRELLWQPDANIWDAQAPVLFPVVGRLKNMTYQYRGLRYKMGLHGFAHSMEFDVHGVSKESASFTLRSSPETLTMYPFEFSFILQFKLEGNRLIKEHTIVNTGGEELYYEVGGHEGYRTTFDEDETMQSYWLQFGEKDKLVSFTSDDDVMLTKKKRELSLKDGRLPLHMELFSRDALILDGAAGTFVELWSEKHGKILTVRYADFKYLGLWTQYMPFDTNYICVEPWSALPDCVFLGEELTEKIGIRRLDAGGMETLSYSVEV